MYLAPSMNPENPDQVEVSRPSDALEAQQAAETAFTNLLLGLGSVALLVGGVAIANVMVMSVLERRMEIGVRRSLGATRREIRYQFLLGECHPLWDWRLSWGVVRCVQLHWDTLITPILYSLYLYGKYLEQYS